MTPPSVLLDDSILAAVVDPDHPDASAAAEVFLELLDGYERHQIRLRARRDHLALFERSVRRTLLAPVQAIHVAGQHHRAAERLTLPAELAPDQRVTLVVMRRERIDRIATFHAAFATFDVQVHPAPAVPAASGE